MAFEISGKLLEIFPTEQKSERFRKREFVVEKVETTGDRSFTDYVKFQATNDKCDMLDGMNKGDEVKVSFNIKGNRWEKNDGTVSYFTNLDAWRIEKASTAAPQGDPFGGGDQGPTEIPPETSDEYEDDLPF